MFITTLRTVYNHTQGPLDYSLGGNITYTADSEWVETSPPTDYNYGDIYCEYRPAF